MPGAELHRRWPWLGLAAGILCCFISFSLGLWRDAKPFNDLFAPSYAVKQFVLHRANPYSAQVNRDIQRAYYGHVLTASEHKDEQRFAYPFYSIVFFWPMAFLKYETLKAIALPLLIAAVAMFAALTTILVPWPASPSGRLTLVFCVLASAPVLRGLRLEQLTILVALLVIGAFVAMQRNHLVLAGVLLAVATIKPQITLVPVLWSLLWSLSGWKRRKLLTWSLILSELILLLIAEFLLPGWLAQFLQVVSSYSDYTGANSMLTMLLGPAFGLVVTAVFAIGLLVVVLRARRFDPAAWEFRFTTVYVLGFVAVAMPALAALHNQILLLPAFCAVFRSVTWPKVAWLQAGIAGFSPAMVVAVAAAHNSDFMLGVRVAFWMCLPIAAMAILTFRAVAGTSHRRLAQHQYL